MLAASIRHVPDQHDGHRGRCSNNINYDIDVISVILSTSIADGVKKTFRCKVFPGLLFDKYIY